MAVTWHMFALHGTHKPLIMVPFVWGSGSGVRGPGFGVRGVGCGVWGVGCGVWGVGCGVWGVGCGVWGVGGGANLAHACLARDPYAVHHGAFLQLPVITHQALRGSIKSHVWKVLSTFGGKLHKWLQDRTNGSKTAHGLI